MLSGFCSYLSHELNRAPLTVEAYRTDIEQFCEWLCPNNPKDLHFSSITSNDVRAWLSSLARKGETSRTLRRKIISLRSLFKWMCKTGVIEKSPVQDINLPKIPKPLPDFIKPDEIEAAISRLNVQVKDESEDKATLLKVLVIEILYSLGLRRAELIGINDSDVSFTKGEIKVTGKRSKQRVIPVPQRLLDLIGKWQKVRDENSETDINDSPLIVVNGRRITAGQVYKIVHEALGETSARKKSPHALRHSFASAMLNGGAEIDSVKEFLGHASLSTTQIYTHISLKEIKEAYSMAHPRAEVD